MIMFMKMCIRDRHWYDVDLCHYSGQPYRKGLLYTHSVDHVSGQPVPSHQWVEAVSYTHLLSNHGNGGTQGDRMGHEDIPCFVPRDT